MSLLKEVKSDRTEKVFELLQSPQDLNARDKKTGNTPVHFAIENQNLEILNALLSLEIKPNLNVLNNEDNSPLIYATNVNFVDALEPLLKHGAEANFANQAGRTALHYAALNNGREAAQILLKHHADINKKSQEGSALHIATQQNNDEVAYFLMQNPKIDLTVTDSEGNTFLHIAIENGAYNVFQKFFGNVDEDLYPNLNISELLNKVNSEGNTLLHLAEINSKTAIAQFLRSNAEKYSIELSKKNKEGFTPEECKQQHILKQQEEEEKKKLRKEEAKEIKKQRKVEAEKYNEELKQQEEQLVKKEKEKQRQIEEAYKKGEKLKPVIAVGFILGIFAILYIALSIGIQRKKDNVMDL